MGFRDSLRNVLSFGAYRRVEKRVEEYSGVQLEVQRAFDMLEQKRVVLNRTLEDLLATKSTGVKALTKLKQISKNLGVRERQVSEPVFDQMSLDVPLGRIETTISAGDIAMSTVKGAGVSISTALGTWALVGTYGAASTGTAIGTLSGAAATNATLAWLGGGTLAGGGLGMAGGTAVLGGIVVIPLVVIMGIFSHISASKSVKEIAEATTKALAAISHYNELALRLDAVDRRSGELTRSIEKATDTFKVRFRSVYRIVFPFGFFSRAFRSARRFFGGKFFSEQDLLSISPLLQIAAALAELIDVRIIDEKGNIV